MTKPALRVLVAMVLLGALAGGPARAAGSPGAGVGEIIDVNQPSPTTMTVGAIDLRGVIAVRGTVLIIHAHSGQFSGQFYGCDTPTCLQRGIFGSADFDSTSVSLTGTALPAGPVLGSCQGGGIDIFTYGEVFFTTCNVTISGKPTGPFQVLIDAPVEVPKAEGNFCISQNPLVALVEAPVCASAYTVGSFIPF